jgi:hypothetical protein
MTTRNGAAPTLAYCTLPPRLDAISSLPDRFGCSCLLPYSAKLPTLNAVAAPAVASSPGRAALLPARPTGRRCAGHWLPTR